MRQLEVIRKSTPTFLFNITDANSSGVDISNMGVCMALRNEIASGMYEKHLIIPMMLNGTRVDYFNVDTDNGETVNTHQHDRYCRNLGNGLFSVTLPSALNPTSDTVQYQVMLFKMEQLSSPVRNVAAIVDGETIGEDILPAQYNYLNIVIDSGTITMLDTCMVGLRPAGKRDNSITV